MTNEEKAAILLLSLDEDLAANVMKNLRPSEIRPPIRSAAWPKSFVHWPKNRAG